MNTKPNPVIERIRKALALAKDRAGTPEGDTAARIARNLMDAHAVAQEDLDVAARDQIDPVTKEVFDVGARAHWRRDVVFALAEHCTLRALFTVGTSQMKLFGHQHDIAVCKYLYEVVLRQILRAAEEHAETLPRWWGTGMRRSAYNTFMLSAARGLGHKLRDIRAQAKADRASKDTKAAEVTALAIVSREARVAAFYEASKGRVRSAHREDKGYSLRGYDAGRNVSLSPGLPTGDVARRLR